MFSWAREAVLWNPAVFVDAFTVSAVRVLVTVAFFAPRRSHAAGKMWRVSSLTDSPMAEGRTGGCWEPTHFQTGQATADVLARKLEQICQVASQSFCESMASVGGGSCTIQIWTFTAFIHFRTGH